MNTRQPFTFDQVREYLDLMCPLGDCHDYLEANFELIGGLWYIRERPQPESDTPDLIGGLHKT